jgi:hypothetical protein
MKTLIRTAVLVSLSLLSRIAAAQVTVESRGHRVVPLALALFTESAKFQPSGVAPGLSVGTELPYLSRGGNALFQSFDVGYWYHPDLEHALLLGTGLGYRYTSTMGLFFELRLNATYLHTWSVAPAYSANSGVYHRDDRGSPHFLASAAAGLGFDFSELSPQRRIPLALFARYQLGVETPGPEGAPLYPETQILVGVRVPLQVFNR